MASSPRDRFDDLPATTGRIGAHRAENPRGRGWTTLLWAVVAVIVIVGIGVSASLISQGRVSWLPAEPPTASTDPGVVGVIDTSYSVLILNGTADDVIETTLRESLRGQGWAESAINSSRASVTDYPTTTVYYAAEEAASAAQGLADLIGASVVQLDADYPVPGTAATQLTVVVGIDLTSPPAP